MVGVSASTGSTRFTTRELPGTALSEVAAGAPISRQLENLFRTPPESIAQNQLMESLLSNQLFAPRTAGERGQLRNVMARTQGESALRGLGQATGEQLSAPTARTLLSQQANRVQSLQEQAQIETELRNRLFAQNIMGLLGRAEQEVPQVMGGQRGSSKGIGGSFDPSVFFA